MAVLDFMQAAKRWQRYGEEYLKEGREAYSRFINSSLTISTFLVGFVFIWFQVSDKQLSLPEKITLISSLGALIFSIGFGLWLMLEMNSFLNRSGEMYHEKSDKLFKYILETGKDGGSNYPNDLSDGEEDYSFNPWQFKAQIVLLMLGFLLALLFAAFILF